MIRSLFVDDEEMVDFLGDIRQDIPDDLWCDVRILTGFVPEKGVDSYYDVVMEYA